MFAVLKTGGKQYRVAQGDTLKVEKLEAGEGDSVQFDQVLMVGEGEDVKIGTPYVDGSTVTDTRSELRGTLGRLRTVRNGPDGSLWVTVDASPGQVFQLGPVP